MAKATWQSTLYLCVLVVLILASLLVAFDRYMVREDFQYFETEEAVPDQFDASNYHL